jgi:hypothetical protein
MAFNRFGAAEMIAGVVVASAVCGSVARVAAERVPGARRRTPRTAPSRIVGVAGLDW